MATAWTKVSKGIRYREHATKKHGVKKDRYYSIFYRYQGKLYTEGVGWSSDGVRQETCESILSTLRINHKSGLGAKTYAELRAENIDKHEEVKAQKKYDAELTLKNIFENGYLAYTTNNKKNIRTINNEKGFFKHYIEPFFKNISIRKINISQVDRFIAYLNDIQGVHTKKPLSDSTKRNILAIISQVFTYAQTRIDNTLQNPISLVSKPRKDNARVRFLSTDETNTLLDELKKRSVELHNISLISLFSGMRAGEILKLAWCDVNFDEESIYIKDPKNKASRHAYMTKEVKDVLQAMFATKTSERIFTHTEVSHTFERAVTFLGFNEGIEDTRQKVCFHSLRHTFASWHAKTGTPLFTISKLLGHKDIKMTMRYAHLCPTAEKQAILALQGTLEPKQTANVVLVPKQGQSPSVVEFDKRKQA